MPTRYSFREEVLEKQYAIPLDLKTRENARKVDSPKKADRKQFVREIIALLAIIATIIVWYLVLLMREPTPQKKGGDTHADRNCFNTEQCQTVIHDDAVGV
jgi:hypothetical protein